MLLKKKQKNEKNMMVDLIIRGHLNQIRYELFLVPAVTLFTVFTIFPLLKTVYFSFTDFNGLERTSNFVGLKNYNAAFNDSIMKQALGNTLIYTFFTVIIINCISIPLAVLLDKNTRIKKLERAIFFFPSVISSLLLGYIWTYILSPLAGGALNHFLGYLGIKPIGWLSGGWVVKFSIIMVSVWANTGWHTVVNVAYLQAIPSNYYEAAALDGANRFQQFRYITIPMLAPAITVNTLFLLTNGLKVYELPYALTKGGPGYSNFTVTQIIIQRGVLEHQYGISSALAVMFIIMIMIISVIQFTTMRKREVEN